MRRTGISNIKFIIIFTTIIYFINNIVIYDKFVHWFTTKGILDTSGFIAYSLLGLCLSIALISILSHKYTTKAVAIFVILISMSSTYVIDKYNVAIDRSMLANVIQTNTSESLTLVSTSMLPYFIFLA